MRFTHIRLENWRNFKELDLALQRRMFLVGPNASGKSNFLDVFRFLRDLAEPRGGLEKAVGDRGGVSQVRCFHARRNPAILIEAAMEIGEDVWLYRLVFGQDNQRQHLIKEERVERNGKVVLERPDEDDERDPGRLRQTHLEQVNANREFREVAHFLAEIRYLHVIPQLLQHADRVRQQQNDPFGTDFLERIADTPTKTRDSRLRRINDTLRLAVPNLAQLRIHADSRGVPHLEGMFEHWRPKAGWQNEVHFSDGTLRLIALLWAFMDGSAPLLLEEPELSLHAAIVRHIPSLMQRAGGKQRRQVLISTHSSEILEDEGIAANEVVLLQPSPQGTLTSLASSHEDIVALLEGGMTIGQAVLPSTAPAEADRIALFGA